MNSSRRLLELIVLLTGSLYNYWSYMQRIIYAWNYVEWGGAQIHFLALIREAQMEFESVVVVLPAGTDEQFLAFLDAENVRYVLFRGHIDLRPKSGMIGKIGRHVTRIKSEHAMLNAIRRVGIENAIVHVDLLPTTSLFSLAWLALRVPVFVTLHNAMREVQPWRRALWRIKFGTISLFENFHVFCTNEHAARYFEQLFSKRVSDGIKITYDSINPVAIEEAGSTDFDRSRELERFGIDPEKFVVLTVGQFIDRKGRWTLLEAARIVAETHPDIVFVWVAPAVPGEEDNGRIESFELGDAFRLLRSADVGTDRQSILKFFRVADVFVLASSVEGIPIAMLEAMATGISCISTNVYGIPEAIIHEKTGLLIEPGDAEALAAAIDRLYSEADLRNKLASAGQNYAITKFDEREAAKIVVEAYKAAARS